MDYSIKGGDWETDRLRSLDGRVIRRIFWVDNGGINDEKNAVNKFGRCLDAVT